MNQIFCNSGHLIALGLLGRLDLLKFLSDLVEASVIQLALKQKARLVLIDERKARKVARDIFGL